jgi:molybdopterin/thiamine biosynthesis adenylyltransferase
MTDLNGRGSHVIQQLAHIGFRRFVLYDGDVTEESNLNRLVGATAVDAKAATSKLQLAKTTIYRLQPDAQVLGISEKWQNHPEPLRLPDRDRLRR